MSSGPLTKEYVASIFKALEGSGMEHDKFAEYLIDDLSWTIKGTHPLAGHYKSKKAFQVNVCSFRNPRSLPHAVSS